MRHNPNCLKGATYFYYIYIYDGSSYATMLRYREPHGAVSMEENIFNGELSAKCEALYEKPATRLLLK